MKAVQLEAQRRAHDAVRIMVPIGSVYYVFIFVAHLVVLEGATRTILATLAASSVVLAVAMGVALPRIPQRFAHLLTGTLMFAVWANSAIHVILRGDPMQTTNLVLTVIIASIFTFEWIGFTSILALSFASWAVGWSLFPSDPRWMHFGFALVGAEVLGVMAFLIRRRNLQHLVENQEQLRSTLDEVARSEDRYRKLVALSPVAMILTQDDRVVLTNQAASRLVDELTPTGLRAWLPDPDDGVVERQVARTGRDTIDVEVASVDVDWGGRPARITVLHDVSERKRQERMKDQFVSIVSHELRTPLTSAVGALDLLVHLGPPESPEARKLLDVAQRNHERLQVLVNDLLDLERLRTGRLSLRCAPVDLVDLARETLSRNEPFAGAREVQLHLDEQGPVEVIADELRIEQVVTNLLSNAIRFSEAGSTVTVRVRREGSVAHIEVEDHGSGIPEAFRDRVFERFAQADDVNTRTQGGSGLGLAICRGLVEQHQGTIDFTTETGVGTTFRVDLPMDSTNPEST